MAKQEEWLKVIVAVAKLANLSTTHIGRNIATKLHEGKSNSYLCF